MFRVAEVGGERVAIVHGDADSLAGRGFSQEALATHAGREAARAAFAEAQVRVFASSHACLPVLQSFGAAGLVANNGAAGMPNIAGTAYGLATRISVRPAPDAPYGERIGPLHVEAIPSRYEPRAWLEAFLALWPEGSDAHASYFECLVRGPRYALPQARRAA